MNKNIAVVVPTIRYETEYQEFLKAWEPLFIQYGVRLFTVVDGENPVVRIRQYGPHSMGRYSDLYELPVETVMPTFQRDLIKNFTPACRNLGFATVARQFKQVDYVLTLDDDTRPHGDTIGDHIKQLEREVPVSWLSSTLDGEMFMRGFPYSVRQEAPVWVSHGVWYGVPDLDAPTQLVKGAHHEVQFYKGPVPKGVYMPICGMNLAFRREALPYIYYAPVVEYPGAQRFDDIWMGIHLVDYAKANSFAIVSGYAAVKHERVSNIWTNLEHEAIGMRVNENYWMKFYADDAVRGFEQQYESKRNAWEELVKAWLK